MKTLILALALISTPVFAASNVTVVAARVVKGKTLEVDVRFGGGCKEHNKFELKVGACLESFPVQCSVEINDLTKGDFCEAYLGKTVKFDLEDEGLTESYYNGASLSFGKGEDGKIISVRLPRTN